MKGQVVAFRIPVAQYDELCRYADRNGLTVSEAVRRAVKWMMILQQQPKKEVRTD